MRGIAQDSQLKAHCSQLHLDGLRGARLLGEARVESQGGDDLEGAFGDVARRFDADANPIGTDFQVNTYTAEDQQHSHIDMDADGDFMITWESFQEYPAAATSFGVYAQRFAAHHKLADLYVGVDGRIGSEIHVNTNTAGDQRMPSIMLSHAGDAVIAWTGPGIGVDVFTQRFNVLAWAAMGLLVGTGVHNVIHEQDKHGQAFEYDLRYAWLLVAKLALVALAILLTIYHSYVVGPRLMAHQEAREEGPHVDALRRHSIVVSVANLLVALTILFVVTLLQNEDFSLRGV